MHRSLSPGPVAAALALTLAVACGDPAPTPELDAVVAVEATFGGAWCRRIEAPAELAALTAARRDLDGRWQPAWTPLEASALELRFVGEGTESILGLGNGQVQARVGDRQVFQPIDDAAAARLVALAGGPPVGAPDRPCLTRAAP